MNPTNEKWLERGAETDVHMFPVVLHLKGVYQVKEFTGVPIGTFLMFFRGNAVQYLIKPGAFATAGQALLTKMKQDPNFVFTATKQLRSRLNQLLRYSAQIHNTDLQALSTQELASLHRTWSDKVVAMMKYGSIAPVMEWEDSLLTNELTDYLKQKLRKKNQSHRIGDYLNVLTSPTQELWMTREQRNLHKLAVWVSKHKDFMAALQKQPLSFTEVSHYYPTVARLLRQHADRYHWIYFNYEGPEKREDYFLTIIQEILTGSTHPQIRLTELIERADIVAKQQAAYFQALEIEEEYQHLFRVAQELSYQKGLRRDLSFKAYWQIHRLVEELARRTNMSPEHIRSLLPEETESFLREPESHQSRLTARLSLCAVVAEENGFRYITGEEAETLARQVDSDLTVHETVTELKGNVAYPGQAVGQVKIVQRKEDIEKMERGDILVSSATNPELVPAMKKAAAIITDEGGITCHAAIVSRELKIPCIVGTKIATRVLTDGTRVNVDAQHGIVTVF